MMPLTRQLRSAALASLTALTVLFPHAATAQIRITDDTGREVSLARPAERIVSLAPHLTEVLFAAGAGPRVVGVVAYSDYPEEALKLPQVGGYTNIDLEAVVALQPDLVVAWASGNRAANIDKLRDLGIAVYLNEPRRMEDVARSLENFAQLAGTAAQGQRAASEFRARHAALGARYSQRPAVRMFYQIWDRPLMTINGQHLISDAIRLCGGENVFDELPQIAPTIGVEAVLAADPEVVIASGMGEARPEWLDQWKQWSALQATRQNNLFFIPPQLIQRHTPRLLDGAAQLCEFLETARGRRLTPSAY